MGPGPDSASASAAGACCDEDELAGLDAFLAEALRASVEDKKRTLVIGAPESLVRAEETEETLAMRADFVRRVLLHEVLCTTGRDCEVKAEYVMPIPGWRTGRDGMGAERVEVNFLHVEFADAGQAAALLALFNAHCPGPTEGLEVAWGMGKHVVRLAMEGEAARVMKGSAGVEGGVELTRHPVWRAAVSGARETGLALARSDMLHKFGQLAVVRIMQKFRAWNVAAELSFVAMRPVLARGSSVVRGAMLVVEVKKAPWVLPRGVALQDGLPVARLDWQVVGPKRGAWEDAEPPQLQGPWAGGAGGGKGGAWGGAMGGFGKGASWGKGKHGMQGKGGPGMQGKGKGGFGGKGGKGAGGGLPETLLQEQREWEIFVQSMTGEARERRDLLFACWGPGACPRAIYFTIWKDVISPCQGGQCKTARIHGGQPRPCSVPREAWLGLVPPHLRSDSGGTATGFGPLFGGRPRDGLGVPPCVKGAPRRANPGQCARATRTVARWVDGGSGGGGTGGPARVPVKERLGPRTGAGRGAGDGRDEEGGGEDGEEAAELGDDGLELADRELAALLGGEGEGGAGRRRGRESESWAEGSEGEEPPAKAMRSPARDGGGDGDDDEAMSQD